MEALALNDIKKKMISGMDLIVADNMIDMKIVENFHNNVVSLSFARNEKTFAGDVYPIFSLDFDPLVFETKTIIGATGRNLLDQYMNGRKYCLSRSYVNMCHYGDLEFPHRDCAVTDSDVTVLYYVNKEWKHVWGGETIFYENEDTRFAVLPKPGRFVLFYGAIEHIGSIPTRICSQSRMTLALKYNERKQH
jgi:SM-20-related protein